MLIFGVSFMAFIVRARTISAALRGCHTDQQVVCKANGMALLADVNGFVCVCVCWRESYPIVKTAKYGELKKFFINAKR